MTGTATRDIVVCGIGGMGREVAELLEASITDGHRWRLLGFVDDDPAARGEVVNGLPVLGPLRWIEGRKVSLALGIGSPSHRRRVYGEARRLGVDLPPLVHPSSHLGSAVSLGAGTVVAAGAIMTVNVAVGDGVIVNIGATVSHDVVLDDFATLAPGVHLAGAVHVHEGADIGVGAVAIPGRSIGAWSIVGGGAVVTRDVPPDSTVVGCPARVIAQRTPASAATEP